MKQICLFVFLFISTFSYSQLNYIAANAQYIQGTYVDLGTSGTAITTNFSGAVMTYDKDNSSVQNIGFNFTYNGTVYTQFVLNADGFIKLGSSPGVYGFTVYAFGETNIISAYNTNLTAGTDPEYRVQTSGSPGSRICTIQFKNLNAGTQFSNLNFQIKLYETTNNIELVYGSFVAGVQAPTNLSAYVGIKANHYPVSVVVKKTAATAWASAAFANGMTSATSDPLTNKNDILPIPGATFRFVADPANPQLITDAKVDGVYNLSEFPIPCGGVSEIIQARVTNLGSTTITDLPVTLIISGSNSFSNTKLITIVPQQSIIVNFDPFSPFLEASGSGYNNLSVTVPADGYAQNNTATSVQLLHVDLVSYADFITSPSGNFGFGNNAGLILAKYTMNCTDTVKSVNVQLSSSIPFGSTIYAVLLNASGTIISQSDPFLISSTAGLGTYKNFVLNNPPGLTNTDYYVGLAQTANATTAYYPVSIQPESSPTRPGAYYTLQGLSGGTPVESLTNGRFMIQAVLTQHYDKFDYAAINASNTTSTYTDLGTLGTNINGNFTFGAMTFNEDNSSPQNIGFSFIYNGAAFTQFVLNTNGFIKLGNTAPIVSNYDILSSTDINVIAPFNYDLIAGTGTPEYRVHTTGSVGSRVCTIQFENVRDKLPSQYNNINFQIKLYEISNRIEFVYGTFTPSAAAGATIPAIVGIKGSNEQNSVNSTKATNAAWSGATFIDGPYTGNKFHNWNSTLPTSGRTLRFSTVSDAKVDAIYTPAKIHAPLVVYNHTIHAKVVNKGSVFLNDLPVTLNITGANTFTNTQTVSVAPNDSALINFDPVSTWVNGNNLVSVSVPSDDVNTNNTLTLNQNVSDSSLSYADGSPPVGSTGFGTEEGITISDYYLFTGGTGTVTHLKVYISNDQANVNKTVTAVVGDGLSSLDYSDPYTIQQADLGTYKRFTINNPRTRGFRVSLGLKQSASATPYYPVAYQNQGAFETSYDAKRLMIEAIVKIGPASPSYPDIPIATWNFNNINSPVTAAATFYHASLVSSNLLTRGPGAAASPCSSCFKTTGFGNDGISTANNDYFEFKLSPKPGDTLTLTNIGFYADGDNGFFASSQFAYSLDGTNYTLIGSPIAYSPGNFPNVNLSGIASLQNIPNGTTVSFRYYASGQNATGAWGLTSDLRVTGRIRNNAIITDPVVPAGADFVLANCNSVVTSSIGFTSTGTFAPGNIYYAKMNTSNWRDSNNVIIGSLASNANSGIINITIPTELGEQGPTGVYTKYKIWVEASSAPGALTSPSKPFDIIHPHCNNIYSYFRSVQSGNWNNPSTWETSWDETSWVPSTLAPNEWAIKVIIDTTDTVTITTPVNIRNTKVFGKIKLLNGGGNTGSITFFKNMLGPISDILYHSMFIQRGGVLQVVSASEIFDNVIKKSNTYTPYNGRIRLIGVLGKITVGDGSATNGDGFYLFATSGDRFEFYDGAVFEWNSSSSNGPISNATYFLDQYLSGDHYVNYGHPILRLTTMPAGTFGGIDSTVIKGILEVNTPVTMAGIGKKIFRDGMKGSSILTQASDCGEFKTLNPYLVIPPTDSTGTTIGILDGTLQVNLATQGLTLAQGITVTDSADVILNAGITHSFDTVEVHTGGHLTIDGIGGGLMATGPSELLLDNSDLINRGTISGPGTIRFTGNQVSKLNSPGLITAPILMVNKEVKLTGSSNISQLDLTSNSHITLDSFHLSMGAAPITADNANFIITNDTGRLIRNVTTSEVLFPVGVNNTSYTPVTATNSGIADNLKVRVNPGVSFVVPLDQGNVDRTWFIDSTQGGSILSIKTQWNSNNEQSGFDRSNCFLSQSHGCQPPPNCIDTYYDAAGRTAATGSDPYIQVRSNVTGPTSFIVKSSADTSTFTGNAGNGLWNDPNNWTIGVVPSQTIANGKIIVINYTNGVPCTAIGNIIIQPGGQLIINPNKILTVTGNIINQ